MANNAYEDILKRAQAELSPEEQNRLVGELAQILGRKNGGRHRITDLKGLGKEIWEGVDVKKYIAKERDSWDG